MPIGAPFKRSKRLSPVRARSCVRISRGILSEIPRKLRRGSVRQSVMTIQTKEQLLKDFETLADETHHPTVFWASERIRQHLATIPAVLSAPLTTEEAPECYCPDDCEMAEGDAVCPALASGHAALLPILLKRIGASHE